MGSVGRWLGLTGRNWAQFTGFLNLNGKVINLYEKLVYDDVNNMNLLYPTVISRVKYITTATRGQPATTPEFADTALNINTLSEGVPAGDAVLLVGSVPDSFQSGGLSDVLPLVRVGQLASFARRKRESINKVIRDRAPYKYN